MSTNAPKLAGRIVHAVIVRPASIEPESWPIAVVFDARPAADGHRITTAAGTVYYGAGAPDDWDHYRVSITCLRSRRWTCCSAASPAASDRTFRSVFTPPRAR